MKVMTILSTRPDTIRLSRVMATVAKAKNRLVQKNSFDTTLAPTLGVVSYAHTRLNAVISACSHYR